MKLIMIVATAILALTTTAEAAGAKRMTTAQSGNSVSSKTIYAP